MRESYGRKRDFSRPERRPSGRRRWPRNVALRDVLD